MMYIENGGVLYRGPNRNEPQERWAAGQWIPYTGSRMKPYEWGYEISEDEARELMADREGRLGKNALRFKRSWMSEHLAERDHDATLQDAR